MGGLTGAMNPPGGAPKPDPERVATIRYTIVDEPETCAAFGESARAGLASLNERALAETRSGDLGECSLLLDHVHDRLAGLDPAQLQPRTGLAGLFDSRGKRLKAFRAAYASAAAAVTQSAADIGDRAGALSRKSVALETLWSETRDAIAELDAHIAAARSWLANETPAPIEAAPVEDLALDPVEDTHERCEAQADAQAEAHTDPLVEPLDIASSEATMEAEAAAVSETETAPIIETLTDTPAAVEEPPANASPEAVAEVASDPQSAPVAALPHPLVARLAALEAVRATAIGRLPLLRAAQNADCRAPAALKQICDGVEAWRADWQDALGLAGKRPKTIRPDRVRLSNASTALTDRIQSASRELSDAQARRAELEARTTPPRAVAQLAA